MMILGQIGPYAVKFHPHIRINHKPLFPLVLLFWACHCISSAMSRQLYIRSNHGITGKRKRIFQGTTTNFNPGIYFPSSHFRHLLSFARFLWNNTQPFTHVWMFSYPKPSLVICFLHWLSFAGNAESCGKNWINNVNTHLHSHLSNHAPFTS